MGWEGVMEGKVKRKSFGFRQWDSGSLKAGFYKREI